MARCYAPPPPVVYPLHCRKAPSAGGTSFCFCSALHLTMIRECPLVWAPPSSVVRTLCAKAVLW